MNALDRLQLVVEPTALGLTAVRVAGELTAENGKRLLRLLDNLIRRASATGPTGRIVVDLANVRRFDVEGVCLLRHARHGCDLHGIALTLAGIDAHRDALPRRIEALLAEFDMVESIDSAVRALGGGKAV